MNDFPIWVQLLPKVHIHTVHFFYYTKITKYFYDKTIQYSNYYVSDPVQGHHWQQSEQEGRRAVVNTL